MTVRKSKAALFTIAFLGVVCSTQVKASRWLDLEETALDARIRVARTFDLINADDNTNYARQYLSIAERNLDIGEYQRAARNGRKALDHGGEAIRRIIPRPLAALLRNALLVPLLGR